MNQYTRGFAHNFFLVTIMFLSLAVAGVPPLLNAFRSTTNALVGNELKKIYADALFYDIEHGSFEDFCSLSEISIVNAELIYSFGGALSCQVSSNARDYVIYSKINENEYLCIDDNTPTPVTIYTKPSKVAC